MFKVSDLLSLRRHALILYPVPPTNKYAFILICELYLSPQSHLIVSSAKLKNKVASLNASNGITLLYFIAIP